MGITVANIPTAEALLAAAGKPMMIASNALERATSAPRWVSTTTGLYTDADVTAANNPTRYAFDRFQNRPTKPDIELLTIYKVAFVFKLHTPDVFDFLFCGGHNFNTISATSTWKAQLDIADDAAFSTNLVPGIFSWTGTTGVFGTAMTNHRLVSSSLGTGPPFDRYTVSGDGYGRLWIGNGSLADTTPLISIPQFGELLLGRRRQMTFRPNVPYDEYGLGSDSTNQRSKSGVDTDYIRNAGGREVTIKLSPWQADDIATIRAWYADCGWGPQKFVWFENPNLGTYQTLAYWMRAPRRLPMPLVGPFEQDVSFDLIEQSPFVTEES